MQTFPPAEILACTGLDVSDFGNPDSEEGASTNAEGIAVGQPGRLTRQLIAERVDDLVLVDEGDLEQALLMLLEIEKTPVEGAGAAGLTERLKQPERFARRHV